MFIRQLLIILALSLFFAAPAHAKRGIAIINTGDELFEVADFPDDVIKIAPGARNAKVGYKCSHVGLFWADIWTWDCKMVAVTGDNSYGDLPPDIAAMLDTNPAYTLRKAKRGFWNHYAFPTLLFGIAAFAVFGWFKRDKEESEGVAVPG